MDENEIIANEEENNFVLYAQETFQPSSIQTKTYIESSPQISLELIKLNSIILSYQSARN